MFFFKFKSPYCMIISFLIHENEIFAYKIIHIPVKYFMYKENTLHIWYILLPHWHQYQVHTGQWTLHRSIYRWALNRSYSKT